MVGDGDSLQRQFLRLRDQALDPRCAVEQRILGVAMDMAELAHTLNRQSKDTG